MLKPEIIFVPLFRFETIDDTSSLQDIKNLFVTLETDKALDMEGKGNKNLLFSNF